VRTPLQVHATGCNWFAIQFGESNGILFLSAIGLVCEILGQESCTHLSKACLPWPTASACRRPWLPTTGCLKPLLLQLLT